MFLVHYCLFPTRPGSFLPFPLFLIIHLINSRSAFYSLFINYKCTRARIGSGCGGSVFNTRGTVTSPGYPGNVSRTTDCRWELAVPIGMLVKIDFPGNKDNENLLISALCILFFLFQFFIFFFLKHQFSSSARLMTARIITWNYQTFNKTQEVQSERLGGRATAAM